MFNLCIVSLYRGCLFILAVNKSCKHVTAASLVSLCELSLLQWCQEWDVMTATTPFPRPESATKTAPVNKPSEFMVGIDQCRNRRVFSGPKKLDMWMSPMQTKSWPNCLSNCTTEIVSTIIIRSDVPSGQARWTCVDTWMSPYLTGELENVPV